MTNDVKIPTLRRMNPAHQKAVNVAVVAVVVKAVASLQRIIAVSNPSGKKKSFKFAA